VFIFVFLIGFFLQRQKKRKAEHIYSRIVSNYRHLNGIDCVKESILFLQNSQFDISLFQIKR